MISLRKDYLLDRWVIISEKRGQRPHQFESQSVSKKPAIDFFAPGNEHLTPPEIGRLQKNGRWQIRWFANKFAATDPSNFKKASGNPVNMPAYGFHEVIVETPGKRQLWDLSKKELQDVLLTYSLRIKELSKKKHIKYVSVFKNNGKEAGTSVLHSHTQVIALPIVPEIIQQKKKAVKKGKTNYQNIIKKELKTKRKAFETKHFGAICPYASRFNYELLIAPKKKYSNITDMSDDVIKDLASMMEKVLKKIRKMKWPYNFYLQYDSKKEMCFHIELIPRLATWAGFEYSTGIAINSVAPEEAAKFYRK